MANMESQFPLTRCCISILATTLFYTYAASDGSSYSWQPVQNNMRMRRGDYQMGISKEDGCKTRCVETQNCIGIDWHTPYSTCLLLYDAHASPYSENGYRHWRIMRVGSTIAVHPEIVLSTLESSTTSVRSRPTTPTVTSGQTLLSDKEDIKQDVVHDLPLWQPVQQNLRMRSGSHQPGIPDEEGCKDRCVNDSDCVGIDWHISSVTCHLIYDCNASTLTEVGYHHWELRRYKSTPITCQGLLEARRHLNQPVSIQCSTPDNVTTVVRVLSVLLGVSTLVVAALLCNTWKLHRQIRNCTCEVKKLNFAHKAQENGYQSYNRGVIQPAPYTDMVRTLPPIPYESEIFYADIDDGIHL